MNTNKLKNKSGFTLVEMIVTLLTVTLVTGLFLVLVNLVKNVYVEMEEASEGQIINSTITNAIQDELRYASYVETTGEADAEGYYSFSYCSESLGVGDGCSIMDTLDVTPGATTKSSVFVKQGDKEYELVSSKSYVFNLEAFVDARYNPELQKFKVKIKVGDFTRRSQNSTIIETEFIVIPLNKKGL